MKNFNDIIQESLLDDSETILNRAEWTNFFGDPIVAEKTMVEIQRVIKKTNPRKSLRLTDKWSIDLYYGFYAMGIGAQHSIILCRKNEVYCINWIKNDKGRGEVKCSFSKDKHIITPIYELPEELEWLIDVITKWECSVKLWTGGIITFGKFNANSATSAADAHDDTGQCANSRIVRAFITAYCTAGGMVFSYDTLPSCNTGICIKACK